MSDDVSKDSLLGEEEPFDPTDYLGVPYLVELHPANPRHDLRTTTCDTPEEANSIIEEDVLSGWKGVAIVIRPDGKIVARHDGERWTIGGPTQTDDA